VIAELGHFSLILSLAIAFLQGTMPLLGFKLSAPRWISIARPAALLQFFFISMAFACLMYAYVVSDFSIVNVAQNSHSEKPLLYKFTGVWGNHEGSMILWNWILALYGLGVALLGRNLPEGLRIRVLSVQGLIGSGFIAFSLATSNPFLRLDPAPIDGNGLNPILQDPGLAFHPPLLYFGYVGLSMTFSFAVAALLEGQVNAIWARWVRPWTLIAWSGLTAGIGLGSWWAYYELGWGGFWFWDPVENVSFMPWLLATALLHSTLVAEKRNSLKSWTLLLAILGFALSLLGTFLVRSGLLTSVHSFASDPDRGVFILGFLALAVGVAITLYIWRFPILKPRVKFSALSREGAIIINNLLLVVGCITVLIGTLYPLFIDILVSEKVSVGPDYFVSTFVWLMIPLIIMAGIGPLMSWSITDPLILGRRITIGFIFTAVIAIVLLLVNGVSWEVILGLSLATWLFINTTIEKAIRLKLFLIPFSHSFKQIIALPLSAWAMTLAHYGLAIMIAGLVVASNMDTKIERIMYPGDVVSLSGYDFKMISIGHVNGPNYNARQAEIRIDRDGKLIGLLYPERRNYYVTDVSTTEAAILGNWLADLYVVLGDRSGKGDAIRIYHNPLVFWIWGGLVLLVAGGILSLTDRRYRLKDSNFRKKYLQKN
tara:strand:+ start:43652 stop:45619 length:1968 start_codon:yes stop_codon:yes gene_type:complete